MELKPPRAIIFDWDNTLVDTWPTIHEALNKTFAVMGHEPWPIEMVKKRVARSMRDSFPLVFGENWQRAGEIYQSEFRAIHLEKLKALPGAERMLAWLHTKPLHIAIASNKKGINLRKEVVYIGWDKYFSKIIGADDTPKDKPAPDPLFAALEGSNITAGDEVWFVGDTEIDMQCAQAAGCVPVWYGELPQETENYHFAAHIHSHDALIKLLGKILP